MIVYQWQSVTAANRYIDWGSADAERRILINNLGAPWGDAFYFYTNIALTNVNVEDIVLSAVADFREAVCAKFYNVAKNDSTLVPISCIQHIDAIVLYNYVLRFNTWDYTQGYDPFEFMAPKLRDAWKRAVIYRRELATFTKRTIAGNRFPEIVMDNLPSGTPALYSQRTLTRSL